MNADYSQSSQIFSDAPAPKYAGFWERFGAAFLDGLILFIPIFVIGWMMGYNMFTAGNQRLTFMSLLVGPSITYKLTTTAISWLYFALQESGPAQATLGKRALGLRVVDKEGQRISFMNATGRYFGKFVSQYTLLIGYLMVVWDSRKQALHDKMAGTFVLSGQ